MDVLRPDSILVGNSGSDFGLGLASFPGSTVSGLDRSAYEEVAYFQCVHLDPANPSRNAGRGKIRHLILKTPSRPTSPVGYYVDMLHRHFDTLLKLEHSGNHDIFTSSRLNGVDLIIAGGTKAVETAVHRPLILGACGTSGLPRNVYAQATPFAVGTVGQGKSYLDRRSRLT